MLIATKVGLEWEGGRVFRNASRARILQEVEDSLRRLRTDHIDVYQVHWPDPLVTIEETAEAMHTLFEQGGIAPSASASAASRPTFSPIAKRTRSRPSAMALRRGLLSGRMRPDSKFEGDDLRRTDPKFHQPRFGEYLAPRPAAARRRGERLGG